MTNKKSKDGLSVLLRRFAAGGMTLCMAASALPMAAEAAAVKEHSVRPLSAVNDISYTESTAVTNDPYRGFYKAVQISFKRDKSNVKTVEKYLDDIEEIKGQYDFVHLRMDISDFSEMDMHIEDDHKNKIDIVHSNNADISSQTDDVEAALDLLLKTLRKNGQCAVIRFAYDYKYMGKYKGDDITKYTIWEPTDEDTIRQHQEKISAVLSKYPDVIASVECGLIGPWGEMHGTARSSGEDGQYVKRYMDSWLELLPDEISVSVRKIRDVCCWKNWDPKQIDTYHTVEGTPDYRVGMFNDGYMGSPSDLNTYGVTTREKGVAWLEEQARHTLYGGEIVAWDDDNHKNEEPLNNIEFLQQEAFRTHTSYLNQGFNRSVTDHFKETAYKTKSSSFNNKNRDPVYLKDGITEYDYLRNHLGYRFVVKDVKLTKETTVYENFSINTKIENVGFGNLIKNEKAKLIIKGNGKQQTYDLSALNKKVGESAENYDPRYWDSGKDINNKGVTYLTATVDIPDSFPTGDYKVYLKIANDVKDQGEYPVHFANEGDIFDESLNANFLGNFKIVAGTKLTDSSSQAASSSSSKAPAVSSSKPATASSSKASAKSSSKPATASSSKASTKSSSKPATASSSKASTKSSSKPATASSSKASAKSSSKPATASSSKASAVSSSKPATASSSKAPAVSSSKPATASSSKASTKSSSKPATASSSKAPAVSSSKPATASSSKAPVAASRRPSRSSSVAEISSAANIFEPDSSSYVSASSLLTDETSSETSSIADSSSKPQRELNEWKVTKKATCTEDGTEARISADGFTEERAISALGHDDELISETAPSYGHDGEKLYVCKHCGRARIETIPWESDTTGDEDETIMRGDVDANGSINVTDIALTAAHIKGIKALDYAAIKRADVNTDGNVNVTDIAMIAAHIKGIKAIK